MEFLGIWLTLIAALGIFSSASRRPGPRVGILLFALPLLWIVILNPTYLVTFLDFRFFHQPISIKYAPGAELHAYRVDRSESALALDLFASAGAWHDYSNLGYSLHILDQATGESLAGADASASRKQRWNITGRGYFFWIYKQRLSIQFPAPLPSNRAFLLVLSLWREEGDAYAPQKIISSDHPLLSDTQVILSEFVLPAETVAAASVPIARFENGFTLDAADLPERAQAGETAPVSFAWRADKEELEDIVQFLHFGHEDSGAWWVHDQPPLGPRLPTRLWYSGLADAETWQVALPADLAPGRYAVYTGLYRASDQIRLQASNAQGTSYVDARAPLGILIVESP